MPQLAKRNRVPMALASGTSVFVVIVVVASASFTQISALISQGGLAAVPWSLVIYTIPGVVIGGQIGPSCMAWFSSARWSDDCRLIRGNRPGDGMDSRGRPHRLTRRLNRALAGRDRDPRLRRCGYGPGRDSRLSDRGDNSFNEVGDLAVCSRHPRTHLIYAQ